MKNKKILSLVFKMAIVGVYIIMTTVSFAAGNGYGKDLSFDAAALQAQNGTFNHKVILRVFNTRPLKTTTANASVYLDPSFTVGNVTMNTANTDGIKESISWEITSEADRSDDGTNGLKFDLSNVGDKTIDVIMSSDNKSKVGIKSANNRDIYVSYWMKADTYWENPDNVTGAAQLRNSAPLCMAITSKSTVLFSLTEDNYVEENENGWRKMECIIPAADTNDLRIELIARNNTSEAYAIDRDYIYVDDIYIAEIPSKIEINGEDVYEHSDSVLLSGEAVSLAGVDAAGEKEDLDVSRCVFEVKEGNAEIVDGKLIYRGSYDAEEKVKLKINYEKLYLEKELTFKKLLTFGKITVDAEGIPSVIVNNQKKLPLQHV